ncbi:MAG: dienelactone hydrolase family protein [Gammaproteobacteria bacterium]|nr:dienelactone hydrolase family protein [Gammaproteobacteria bacterium]
MQRTQDFTYYDQETRLEGYLAYNDDIKQKKPVVLVAHDWSGRNEFACKKAEKLASLGYIGFAIDMYGEGTVAEEKSEKVALMTPLVNDRALLFKRIRAAVEAVTSLEITDKAKIAAIGFCFGGLCVLDLARNSTDIVSVVSFHGILTAPPKSNKTITAKVLAIHGYDDPMVPPKQVAEFENEMTAKKCDWQFITYGGTKHAFTNPQANDPGFGTVYNEKADQRSWIAMRNFFTETLV